MFAASFPVWCWPGPCRWPPGPKMCPRRPAPPPAPRRRRPPAGPRPGPPPMGAHPWPRPRRPMSSRTTRSSCTASTSTPRAASLGACPSARPGCSTTDGCASGAWRACR
ncbi:hypothetical protein DDQ68_17265 [Hymenobacter nivis]|uniref:Uncharacterized protein n=1 Tax=Hymenobacter nivis TaxID=1850093 RepID=A0A2Z3GPL7_9BACT|nr:hypothetical protein DDQ68_17265 [Hymenobacter nivis]